MSFLRASENIVQKLSLSNNTEKELMISCRLLHDINKDAYSPNEIVLLLRPLIKSASIFISRLLINVKSVFYM